MKAVERFDETMRELVAQRFNRFDADLGPKLLREFVVELVGRWQKADRLLTPLPEEEIDRLTAQFAKQFASLLSAGPGQEDISRLIQEIAEKLAAERKVEMNPELLTVKFHPLYSACLSVVNVLGSEQPTLFTQMFDFIEHQRNEAWRTEVRRLDHEIYPCAVAAYNRYAIEALRKVAEEQGLWAEAPALAAWAEAPALAAQTGGLSGVSPGEGPSPEAVSPLPTADGIALAEQEHFTELRGTGCRLVFAACVAV